MTDNVRRISLLSPTDENGIRVRIMIGTLSFGYRGMLYTPPDLREWKSYLDAGWKLETQDEAA